MSITTEELIDAYRKFKHHVYFDTSFLFLREKIADFECTYSNDTDNIDNDEIDIVKIKLEILKNRIENDNFDDLYLLIDYYLFPKTIKNTNSENEVSKIIGNFSDHDFNVERDLKMIDAPIEFHIISFLWILRNSPSLQKEYIKTNYANITYEKINYESLNVFIPYFENYKKWRDKAIHEAKNILEKGNDVSIISLDIKDYYHSVDFKNFASSISEKLENTDDKYIFNVLLSMSKKYFSIININENTAFGLPIGILFSSIIANLYLTKFDNLVVSDLKPSFYGRYVDDILIVLNVHENLTTKNKINAYLDKQLLIILTSSKTKDDKKNFKLKNYTNLSIQETKIRKFYFKSDEPTFLIDSFVQELKKNSSEFRLLSSEEDIENDFVDSAFVINYNGSKSKLRSIDTFYSNKFGVTVYLTKLIHTALKVNKWKNKNPSIQICRFFKGERAIDFYSLWERALTFLIIINDKKSLGILAENISSAINSIKSENKDVNINKMKETLNLFFDLSKNMALSLSLNKNIIGLDNDITMKIRKSVMVRHSYTRGSLINYLRSSIDKSYIDFNTLSLSENLDNNLLFSGLHYSPRFIHFHELYLIHFHHELSMYTDSYDYQKSYEAVFSLFNTINRIKISENSYYELNNIAYNNLEISEFKIKTISNFDDSVKIAIANININDSDVKNSFLRKPNISITRLKKLYSVLNQVTEQGGSDFIILPEASIPYNWIGLLCDQAKQDERAIIFGVEHWVVNNTAFNILVTLIPFQIKINENSSFKSLIPIFRIKNHVSPEERKILNGYHLETPKMNISKYNLINYKNLRFTIFNCFELADIVHRSVFRSEIDILFACEFNLDINYFSNIVESSARDLHCYIVQSNTAEFGDSRITQPTQSERKDILKVKGGINSTVLIDKISIKKLREFQYKSHNLQLDDKSFKPTPPGFDHQKVGDRLNIKPTSK